MDAIRPLLEQLKDRDSEVSGKAISELHSIIYDAFIHLFKNVEIYAVPEVIETLIAFLNDKTRNGRWMAATILGFLRCQEAVDSLLECLDEQESDNMSGHSLELLKAAAIKSLGRIGNKKAGPYIISFLKSRKKELIINAIDALGLLGDSSAVEPLLKRLRDKRAGVAIAAAEALGKVGEGSAVEPLIEYYHSSGYSGFSGMHQKVVIEALGRIGDITASDFLISCLESDSAVIRCAAEIALAKIKAPEAVTFLIRNLHDEDKGVRQWAIWALSELGDIKAIDPLIQCFNEEELKFEVRGALVKFGESSKGPLIAALKSNNPAIRTGALEVLAELGSLDNVMTIITSLRDEDPNVRKAATEALGVLNDQRAVEHLINCLNDEDSKVRVGAADALEKLGNQKAVVPLIELLFDEDFECRLTVADVLGTLGDKRAIEPLIACLKEEDEDLKDMNYSNEVGYFVIGALGKLGALQACPHLVSILINPEYGMDVRIQAVKTLGTLNYLPAVIHLISLLKDTNEELRDACGEALIKMKPLLEMFIDKYLDLNEFKKLHKLLQRLSKEKKH
ncbi:MAG: HEAT repeat domain-containing protein [Candidatus Helarchaeota archaeon]